MLITDKNVLKSYAIDQHLWVGIPSIEVTRGGRTFLTFYSGGIKEEVGNYCLLIQSDDGKNFSEPIAACYEEGHRCYDPCLWIDPTGRLWFTWSRCPDDGLFAAICDDPDAEEIVFGEEFFIAHNVMMNKPTVLSAGEWLFPIAVWKKDIIFPCPEHKEDMTESGTFAYQTCDGGRTFKKLGASDVKDRSYDEHMFLELKNGVVRCFVRTNYGIGAADSYDGGIHWGADFDTGYKGPCSRFFIRRLPSGRILLVNHYEYSGRNNLTAMLSEDEGKTFPYRLLLDERREVAYPDAVVDSEGRIHITYDRERGALKTRFVDIMNSAREILTACITEEDILNGRLTDERSYLKHVAYKLTDYEGELQNPFAEKERFNDSEYAVYLKQTVQNEEDIISQIFDAYGVNCSNIHNIEAKTLDQLIEYYMHHNDLETLNRIIALVRCAGTQSNYAANDAVSEICKAIVENPESVTSLDEMAESLFFSVHYLRHLFRKKTGMTFNEFKTTQRIKKAKLLLRTSRHKIIDIAAACGFENACYFTLVFTKNVGVSPTEYRKAVKGEDV